MIKLEDTLKGVFLLVLAVAGNFIAETLGCKTQKLLSENMYSKHFISLFVLYFAIGFVNSDSPQHPITVIQTNIELTVVTIIGVIFISYTAYNKRMF